MARRGTSKLAEAYRDLWATEHGKLVLTDLMTRAGVMTDEITTDPTLLAIEKGKRHIGLYIAQQICSRPSEFVEVSRQASTVIQHFFGDDN